MSSPPHASPPTPGAPRPSCLLFAITLVLPPSSKIFLNSSLCSENAFSVPQYSRVLSIPSPVGTVLSLLPALPWALINASSSCVLLLRPGVGPSLCFTAWELLNNYLWISVLPRRRGVEGREHIKLYKVVCKEDHGDPTDRQTALVHSMVPKQMARGSVALVFLCYLGASSNKDLGFYFYSILPFRTLILVSATGIFIFQRWGVVVILWNEAQSLTRFTGLFCLQQALCSYFLPLRGQRGYSVLI